MEALDLVGDTHTFEAAGTTVAYRDTGAGPVVLFLHNGGSSSTIWRHQIDALSSTHRTVALDLPGFGRSPRPGRPLDLAGLVELVGTLVDELGVTEAVVVGNCMGSNIAAHLARERPSLVAGLVLVNPLTAATFSAGRLGLLHRMRRHAPRATRAVRQISRRVVLPGPVPVGVIAFQLGRRGRRGGLHHDEQLLALNRRADQLPALIDVLDDLDAYGAVDDMDHLEPPTTVAWGMQNRVLAPRSCSELARHLGVERAVGLPGCGHLPMLEDPPAVTSLVLERCAPLVEAQRVPL